MIAPKSEGPTGDRGMRKLLPVEKSGVLLAIVMVLFGGWLTLYPNESIARIAANSKLNDKSYILKLSKQECRSYGLLTICAGCLIGTISVYPLKK